MAAERYVLLGLGTSRSPWFTEVARWATVGSIPADFVKCIAPEEMRVRLTTGRPFSALLIDAATGAVDRDLLDTAARLQVAVLVVDGSAPGTGTAWTDLGATAVLPPDLRRETLLDALSEHARMIGAATDLPLDAVDTGDAPTRLGHLVAVTGAGGSGVSTLAMAIAQGLGDGPLGRPVLADLCLDADQAMLHDARDIVPGLQELVDAHRSHRPRDDEVQALTFDVVNRGYNLLLGLRRHRDWAVLRPRSFEAALQGLRGAFGVVVADVDDDLEGEAECGSVDVEERNVMARTVAARADVVVVVGSPGVKGMHGLVRTVNRLREHGVPPERILAVINRSAKTAKARAELTRSFAELSGSRMGGAAVVGPVHVQERRGLDEILRDGGRLPQSVAEPVGRALVDLLRRAPEEAAPSEPVPVPIAPGSLGSWAEEEEALG
jgi:MinD-like ATPase involved in chromosome partitioning or flagellar assembly